MRSNEVKNVFGFDFNKKFNIDDFLNSFSNMGFQASHLAEAIEVVKMMVVSNFISIKKSKREQPIEEKCLHEFIYTPKNNCTIFLGYTSNMVSSGNRDIIRYLVEHSLVDVIVTTGGGIEEDIIKCLAPTHLASFRMNDSKLREQCLNRIGNLIIPSKNYTLFEDWIQPILTEMLQRQNKNCIKWTPSEIIRLLGEKINNESSIYYWAYKNNIPVFCPALTDGSFGDMIYFYSINNPGLIIDIALGFFIIFLFIDLTMINNLAKFSHHTGMIILGAGLIKHHICNANLMRNGADFSVFINTSMEYDGSDSGAEPTEAVSWGKIKSTARAVKIEVYGFFSAFIFISWFIYLCFFLCIFVTLYIFNFNFLVCALLKISEYFEESSSVALKVINVSLIIVSGLALILLLFGEIPVIFGVLLLISHVLFKMSLITFPVINFSLPLFIAIGIVAVNHIVIIWKGDSLMPDTPFMFTGFATLFLWAVPIIILVSINEQNISIPSHAPICKIYYKIL
ncbi:hypothetical protein HZS_1824 [Henneguya salminicola]|nr:hypothetical protein HZS_1824 [Henneguya salminicola]